MSRNIWRIPSGCGLTENRIKLKFLNLVKGEDKLSAVSRITIPPQVSNTYEVPGIDYTSLMKYSHTLYVMDGDESVAKTII